MFETHAENGLRELASHGLVCLQQVLGETVDSATLFFVFFLILKNQELTNLAFSEFELDGVWGTL